MSDEELEQRLRAAMNDRAGRVDPHLSGPDLRRRATLRNRPGERLRRAAPVLASAAAVAVIAVSVALVARGGDDPAPTPIQPGGGRTDTSVSAPTTVPAPRPATPSPPAVSTTPSRSMVIPVRPGRPSGTPSIGLTRAPESSVALLPSRPLGRSSSPRVTPPTRVTVPARPTSTPSR